MHSTEAMTASVPVGRIVSGETCPRHLRPSQKILQEQLAAGTEEPDPARRPSNELQAEGLVVHEPNRGCAVADCGPQTVQVYRLRELLGRGHRGPFAGTSVTSLSTASGEQADEVELALSTGDLSAIRPREPSFPTAVSKAGMPRLTRILNSLWDIRGVPRTVLRTVPNHRHINEENMPR